MVRADVIYLIADNPSDHGVFANHNKTERMVYAEIQSVTRSEFYNAHQNGLQPEYVFRLADEAEYQGEKECRYNGKSYSVIRTYMNEENGIELTVQRSDI